MTPIVRALLAFVTSLFRSRVSLQVEIVSLRHQLTVYERSIRRPRVRRSDRIFWSWLARHWARWREVLVFVQPATVLAWQRQRFRDHWARLSRREPGRPAIPTEVRALIREISAANPRWGFPRIQGELRKSGIAVAKSTGEKYRVRHRTPPSATWTTVLRSHVTDLMSIDFFPVPTVGFRVLFVLGVFAHDGRTVIHFNVTEHPTAHWTAQQIVEAFPWETASRYLLRDRDAVSGDIFERRLKGLGIAQVRTAPRSLWQSRMPSGRSGASGGSVWTTSSS